MKFAFVENAFCILVHKLQGRAFPKIYKPYRHKARNSVKSGIATPD